MRILSTVYSEIINNCPIVPPETGGILGCYNGIVEKVYYDFKNASYSSAIYVPDIKNLNEIIGKWNNNNIQFCGLFHSHPMNQEKLSNEDIEYINVIMTSLPITIKKLFFPIIIPKSHIVTYAAIKKNNKIDISFEKNTIIF